MKTDFKVGDFCFHRYTLSQIKEMSGESVMEVTDGYVSTSSNRLNCYPLTIMGKLVSDEVTLDMRYLHDNCGELNFPDISRLIEGMWVDLMENQNDNKALTKVLKIYRETINDIKYEYQKATSPKVRGVSLFRGK